MDPGRSSLFLLSILNIGLFAGQGWLWLNRRRLRASAQAKDIWPPGLDPEIAAKLPEDADEADHRIVHKAIAFSGKTVGEVMVPRPDMVCVRAEAPLEEILDLAARTAHTRLPVFEGDVDHILGFVHAKDLLKLARRQERDPVARDLMRPILAVPENKGINDMLRGFQQQKTHVAIVFDEFGGTAGMVTLNDLLEELVGELFDEWRDGDPEVESLADGRIRLSGRAAIDTINELFGLELPDHEFNTIAGLIFGCLGRTPVPGDEAEIQGVHFCVETTNGRRATQIMMRPSGGNSLAALGQ
ncbi:MAG: hemolysin family protein [Cyanobacteria bacterium REEB65]|nr:hemolysin family protein [Cyanobacteria bacterium REEB65]